MTLLTFPQPYRIDHQADYHEALTLKAQCEKAERLAQIDADWARGLVAEYEAKLGMSGERAA